MYRRTFLRLSSISLLTSFLNACQREENDIAFDIEVHSDMETGHILLKAQNYVREEILEKDILIVGAGLAGLSAAHQLRNRDIVVCELGDSIGGSSSSNSHLGISFAEGAHYDMAYPRYFGKEVLEFLEELNIIEFNHFSNLWEFIDKHFTIRKNFQNRFFNQGKYTKEIFGQDDLTSSFFEMLRPFQNKMTLPTRLLDKELHNLNDRSFGDFLKEHLKITNEFLRSVDYNMLDDYGGTSNDVSALAGIHYYKCRPYHDQYVELFSPPQGNAYFTEKMEKGIPRPSLLTNHLVYKIEKAGNRFQVDVIDVKKKKIKQFQVNYVIYAGQKHALKYIMPEDGHLFEENVYAPWIVMNFILRNEVDQTGFWQNEIFSENNNFLGFVDSNTQHAESDQYRILTAYFCFTPNQRKELIEISNAPHALVNKTVQQIEKYFKRPIAKHIEKVYMKVMGHAMPVPVPGFLFKDQNEKRTYQNLIYAGVDNGRLPLLFEAIDSGIEASKIISRRSI
ncbi:FAD-dependent oxidoreductase [Fulvivirgaceae bacterium BMA10]|uniref:FAD-dependent oxidoreductase n=1 Tax=Splendidivirga corallicola TaxID=3051826 RepID=A0ABT8KIH2_9BACT|nr:FAD-dependent oxidoreductase [Fulvivirgaceae bacterium BMA10]